MEYGLLGERLVHSFSPMIHEEFGDYSYELIEKNKGEINSFFKERNFKGLNVTNPYKRIAKQYCDYLDEVSKKTGCVNTIVNKNGKLYGYNTDYYGFLFMLNRMKIRIKNPLFLIVGNGATSVMVKTVLFDLGYKNIKVVSRRGERNIKDLDYMDDTNILINCTPLGTYPHENDDYPIDIRKLKELKAVIDLNYNPIRTKLLLDAQRIGCEVHSGLLMLIAQAKKSAELFGIGLNQETAIEEIYCRLRRKLLNIVFIGMPGSGKTVVGQKIAKKMNRFFVDIDEEIQKEQGMTAEEIILEKGIEYFRRIEKQIVKNQLLTFSKIISTGGGVIESKENINYLKYNSVVIFLNRDLNKLETIGRPLSQGGLKGLKELYNKRNPIYLQESDIVINNNDEIESAINEVLSVYEKNIDN